MKLDWNDLGSPRADRRHGRRVEISGWATTVLPVKAARHFLLTAEPGCCAGCVPANPLAVVEVVAERPIALAGRGALRLSGRLVVVPDHGDGWRYRLEEPRLEAMGRRTLLAASALAAAPVASLPLAALAQMTDGTAVDAHSHAGNLIQASFGSGSFSPVAEPMRQGGVSAMCLAIVADSPVVRMTNGRLRATRDPHPGELHTFSERAFAALHALAGKQGMPLLRTAAELRAARSSQPSLIVASEGADFLEGRLERLDQAYQRWGLRHLQLTHYRPNELGDIQTEPSVNGGLTAFGAEVVRRCNALGIVVDVAHGTLELVKKAAAVTRKPLVLSHTSLTERPTAWTRLIVPDHARAIAATRGVIGIWPIVELFPTIAAYAAAFARMVDVVGIDHVGLGTDQLGLPGGSSLPSYADLPQLAAALRDRFTAEETAKLLGGNYRRVFEASLA